MTTIYDIDPNHPFLVENGHLQLPARRIPVSEGLGQAITQQGCECGLLAGSIEIGLRYAVLADKQGSPFDPEGRCLGCHVVAEETKTVLFKKPTTTTSSTSKWPPARSATNTNRRPAGFNMGRSKNNVSKKVERDLSNLTLDLGRELDTKTASKMKWTTIQDCLKRGYAARPEDFNHNQLVTWDAALKMYVIWQDGKAKHARTKLKPKMEAKTWTLAYTPSYWEQSAGSSTEDTPTKRL